MNSALQAARAYLLKGSSALLNAGQKEQAIQQLETGLDMLDNAQPASGRVSEELRKTRWQMLLILGQAHASKPNPDPDRAIQCLQQALDILDSKRKDKKSDHSAQEREGIVRTLSQLGDNYSFKKKYREALGYYKRAADIKTANQQGAIWIQQMLGNTYLALGKRSEALRALQAAAKMDPEFQYSDGRFVCYHLAQIHYEKKRYTKALEYGIKALVESTSEKERFPQTYLVHQGLGHIYFAMSSYENAVMHFRESLRLAPLNAPERADITRHLNAAKERLD